MESVLVALDPTRSVDGDQEVVIIDDVDALTDAAIVMGCGDDNPYR